MLGVFWLSQKNVSVDTRVKRDDDRVGQVRVAVESKFRIVAFDVSSAFLVRNVSKTQKE